MHEKIKPKEEIGSADCLAAPSAPRDPYLFPVQRKRHLKSKTIEDYSIMH